MKPEDSNRRAFSEIQSAQGDFGEASYCQNPDT